MWVDCVTICNPALGEEPDYILGPNNEPRFQVGVNEQP